MSSVARMWSVWESHAKTGHYPFDFAPYEAVREVIQRLIPVFDQDRESWGREFTAAAERHEHDHFQAYGLYRMARYPTPSTPLQPAAYRNSQEHLIAGYPARAGRRWGETGRRPGGGGGPSAIGSGAGRTSLQAG